MDTRDFPLSSQTKQGILNSIFDHRSNYSQRSDLAATSYFAYYERVVKDTVITTNTLSHHSIATLIKHVKNPKTTRSSIESILINKLQDQELENKEEIIEESLKVAVCPLLMVPIQCDLTGRSITGETKLKWKEGTLKNLVDKELVPQVVIKESVKLDKIFHARNLERIAGIKVRWTSNLADHLRMRDDDKTVEIFHHASFLKFHKSCHLSFSDDQVPAHETQRQTVLPPAFINETLRTLALLLPEHDKSLKTWFITCQFKESKKEGRLPLDPSARECGQLKAEQRHIEKFEYWHDRLVILKQVFDEAEPCTIKQWWCDKRKRVQWYTFWVAALVLALTVFFGLVQSIEGALQVYLAARKSF